MIQFPIDFSLFCLFRKFLMRVSNLTKNSSCFLSALFSPPTSPLHQNPLFIQLSVFAIPNCSNRSSSFALSLFAQLVFWLIKNSLLLQRFVSVVPNVISGFVFSLKVQRLLLL